MLTSTPRSDATTDLQTTTSGRWTFRYAAATDTGRRRDVNEDFFLLHPDRRLFVIADGMGGHAAGEVASRITAETLAAYFEEAELPLHGDRSSDVDETMSHHLIQAVKIANSTVFDEAQDSVDRRGMGTTVVALSFSDERAHFAHVGDSRLYRLRDTHLEQLTRDHSLLEQTIGRQDITGEEAEQTRRNFPYKIVLTRAIGSRYVVDVDADSTPVEHGDLFVLTTDGVHDVISDAAIADALLASDENWHQACRHIIAGANLAGGPDNITVVCVQVHRR